MDVNAIWAPHALESIGRILDDASRRSACRSTRSRPAVPDLAPNAPLGRYVRDPQALSQAVERWYGASRHFVVRLCAGGGQGEGDGATRRAARGRAASLDRACSRATKADRDSLVFLALALDAGGQPIGVANSDPATRLFLGERESGVALDHAQSPPRRCATCGCSCDRIPSVCSFDRVGPVVANDAYATPAIWRAFEPRPVSQPVRRVGPRGQSISAGRGGARVAAAARRQRTRRTRARASRGDREGARTVEVVGIPQ